MSKEVPQYDLDGLHGIITSSPGHHDLVYFFPNVKQYFFIVSKRRGQVYMTRVIHRCIQPSKSFSSLTTHTPNKQIR